jgi:hypothetical protein
MRLAERLPDGFTDADLDAATREAAMAAFAKSWRRESGQCPLSGVKRTKSKQGALSAFDAVDGAHSAASKCHRVVASKRTTLRGAVHGRG